MDERIIKILGYPGAMISGSKSGYRTRYPNNLAVFNSNIVIEGLNKVWYGDIDITASLDKLKQLSKEFNSSVYVFHEMDYRFDKENQTLDEAKKGSYQYYEITYEKGLIIHTKK